MRKKALILLAILVALVVSSCTPEQIEAVRGVFTLEEDEPGWCYWHSDKCDDDEFGAWDEWGAWPVYNPHDGSCVIVSERDAYHLLRLNDDLVHMDEGC